MAKQKGRLMLIKIGDGATPTEAFATLCGLRSKSLTITSGEVDVTSASCADPSDPLWRELLDGVKSVSVSGTGLFTASPTEASAVDLKMSDSPRANFQIIVPALGTFQGQFLLTSLEYGGEQEDGVTYSLSLESSGAVTFTAV